MPTATITAIDVSRDASYRDLKTLLADVRALLAAARQTQTSIEDALGSGTGKAAQAGIPPVAAPSTATLDYQAWHAHLAGSHRWPAGDDASSTS